MIISAKEQNSNFVCMNGGDGDGMERADIRSYEINEETTYRSMHKRHAFENEYELCPYKKYSAFVIQCLRRKWRLSRQPFSR